MARNELADALAHYSSHAPASQGPVQLHLPSWFEHDLDGLAWAPHAFLCGEAPHSMPNFVQGTIQWDTQVAAFQKDPVLALQPFLPEDVLQAQPMKMQTATLLFRVASFLTLSLLEADAELGGKCRQGLYGGIGWTALLAQCLSSKGIHMAGIQEAKTPPGPSAMASFGFVLVLISPGT